MTLTLTFLAFFLWAGGLEVWNCLPCSVASLLHHIGSEPCSNGKVSFLLNLFMYMLHHLPHNFMWFSLIFICQCMFGIFVGVIMPMMLLDLFCLHVLQVFVDRIPISFLGQGLGMAAVGTPRNRSFNGSNSKEKAARARWQPVAQIESKVGASLGAGMGWPVVWRNT